MKNQCKYHISYRLTRDNSPAKLSACSACLIHSQILHHVEDYLLSESFIMPVYFAVETPEVLEMFEAIEDGTSSVATRSATEGK